MRPASIFRYFDEWTQWANAHFSREPCASIRILIRCWSPTLHSRPSPRDAWLPLVRLYPWTATLHSYLLTVTILPAGVLLHLSPRVRRNPPGAHVISGGRPCKGMSFVGLLLRLFEALDEPNEVPSGKLWGRCHSSKDKSNQKNERRNSVIWLVDIYS